MAAPSARAADDPLAPLRFLLGEWKAIDRPPGESGSFTFKTSVQDRVIVRTNEAVYPATDKRPASRHDDLMVIHDDRGALKADYYDSEGHTIRYDVQVPGPGRVVFVSAPSPEGPRYRLSYTVDSDGVLKGTFEIAPPGTPEAYKPYLSWSARKG